MPTFAIATITSEKVNRALVVNENAAVMIALGVDAARASGVRTVAEGVETRD
ncbi:hypothetical protein [Leifsonia sp. fls2-241-R2A-40a]|uniref:hypothetical protein n=1 Tax=Leifsonia sp. fls2-241-R2A-40a TaxID=3040290 RepID=UPI00254D7056|nr:hypothetical protein [Leifsonia sp. fls2-241-R2A-40a]